MGYLFKKEIPDQHSLIKFAMMLEVFYSVLSDGVVTSHVWLMQLQN